MIAPKKKIQELRAYDPGLFKGKYKLDANENSYELPKNIISQIIKKLINVPINRYPDPNCSSLKKAMAKRLKVKPENIVFGNGSDELLFYLMLAYLEPGDTIVVPEPTFAMYEIIAQSVGARTIKSKLTSDSDIDAEDILKKVKKHKAKFVFLAYPNNPTGKCFSDEQLLKLIDNTDCFVVMDEAYYEFSQRTYLPLISAYDNVIVMRTFSKAFSMAGLRLGYMISNCEVISVMNKIRLPYNINSLSQAIAELALKHEKTTQKSIDKIICERERVQKELKGFYEFPESDANFIYIKFKNAAKAKKAFEKAGVSIRMFASGYARITIGTPEENNAVLKILKRGGL